MSIDDRLRDGLVRNAELQTPPVERHLAAVRRRRRRTVQRTVLLVAAAVVLLAAVPVGAVALLRGRVPQPTTPTASVVGTYRVEVEAVGATASMTGTWQVRLTRDETMELTPPPGYAGPADDGETYRLDGRTFTTNAFIGRPGCQSSAAPVGRYEADVTAGGITFALLRDECAPRVALFGGPWERVR